MQFAPDLNVIVVPRIVPGLRAMHVCSKTSVHAGEARFKERKRRYNAGSVGGGILYGDRKAHG